MKRRVFLFVTALFIAAGLVGAATPSAMAVDRPINIDPGRVDNIPAGKNASQLLPKVLNAVYVLAASIAVISLIWAGFLYITSNGDSSKTATARQAIIYSMVGLVIVGLAFIITGVIQNLANS